MLFWNSKQKESELNAKIDILKGELADIKLQLRLLDSDLSNLRGRFNRQLGGLSRANNNSAGSPDILKEEEKVAPKEEEKPKPLNTGGAVVFTGMNYGTIPK